VIQLAAKQDYDGFAKLELETREELGYPPFTQVLKLVLWHKDEAGKQPSGPGGGRLFKTGGGGSSCPKPRLPVLSRPWCPRCVICTRPTCW
jgi:hypothetical protein